MNCCNPFESILPFVEKPSRYIGMEHGIMPLKHVPNPALKVCLAFPDVYEIGMSHLGIKILYSIVNALDTVLVDLVFLPQHDYATLLKSHSACLQSLHYGIPLCAFDLVGFSLAYELSYINVLEMLHLGNIPLTAAERTDTMPLVIAGGGCTANPEPVADFFDACVLGDAEETIVEIVEACSATRKTPRAQRLDAVAAINGVYVPSLYTVEYNGDVITRIIPQRDGMQQPTRRIVRNLDTAPFPTKSIVPFVEVVHNHLSIEIQRGCFRGCKFCQAGFVQRPVRIRSQETIQSLIKSNLAHSGYDNVSLLSLSVVDYPHIEELLAWFLHEYEDKRISISLPSLRCDKFSLEIAHYVSKNKKSSLTFAPEAGSQTLRDRIGKCVTEENIFQCVEDAYRKGWHRVKLYFMYGLPDETDEDLAAIPDLVKRLKRACKGMMFTVTISAFVPKSHTPFQWYPQNTLQTLLEKKQMLIASLNHVAQVKHSAVESSIVEGFLSRGDRRAANVIATAWKGGAQTERDHIDLALWRAAAAAHGLDLDRCIARTRTIDEKLPWSHLDFGLDPHTLYTLASAQQCSHTSCPSEHHDTSIAHTPTETERLELHKQQPAPSLHTRALYQVCYEKSHSVRFLSHLEIAESLRKALRRSGLPLAYAHQFHPLPKMSFCPPLPVGVAGNHEWCTIELTNELSADDVYTALSNAFPLGLVLKKIQRTAIDAPSLDRLLKYMEYEIERNDGGIWDPAVIEQCQNSHRTITLQSHKGKERSIVVHEVLHHSACTAPHICTLVVNTSKTNVNIFGFMQALFMLPEATIKQCRITRTNVFIGTGNVLVEL